MSRTPRGVELLPSSLVEPEARLAVTAEHRQPTRLDDVTLDLPPPEPTVEELRSLAATVSARQALWLAGGEPTLRRDLPQIVAAARATGRALVGLVTDGLALTSPQAVAPLRRAGLSHVRIGLHAADTEAHDWLVDRPGAARRAIRALRICAAAGLAVEIEATLTRPTAAQLIPLAELAAHRGVAALHLRRLTARGPAAKTFLGLAPRLGLLADLFDEVALVALRRRLPLALHGVPRCTAGLLAPCTVPPDRVRWLVPGAAAWETFVAAQHEAVAPSACPACPGAPACSGAPADYVAHFGAGELDAEGVLPGIDPLDAGGTDRGRSPGQAPPPRAGRPPIARRRWVVERAARDRREQPSPPRAAAAPAPVLRIAFGGRARVACPDCGDGPAPSGFEPTRAIRRRLVRAAGEGAERLRIVSAATLVHPAAPRLIEECRLLRFGHVEVAGEGSILDELDRVDLRALRWVDRVDVALYGPDPASHDRHTARAGSFAATLRGLERLARVAEVTVGAYAVLHHAEHVAAYADAWSGGALPAGPAFRLSPRGGSLSSLAETVRDLPAGAARTALTALLPPCLLAPSEPRPPLAPAGAAFDGRPQPTAPPSGSDRLGQFEPCRCAAPWHRYCPGLAVGWDHTGITPAGPLRPPSTGRRRS